MFDKRINVFTGHFGSGKTEVAVNYAFALRDMKKEVAIADLDIVNPFFRTADTKAKLEGAGIKTILPVFANTNVDVPALPGEINIIFEQKNYQCIMDIGGDELGARAVSRYRQQITNEEYNLFMVINTLRPMTGNVDDILEMLYQIESTSNIKVTGFINNTNLLSETELSHIMGGHKIIKEVSSKTGIPIAFAACIESMADEVRKELGVNVLPLNKKILLPWQ